MACERAFNLALIARRRESGLAGAPQAYAEHRDHDQGHQPPRRDMRAVQEPDKEQPHGDRPSRRPVVADDEVVPEADEGDGPRPDAFHDQTPGLKPSARRRSMVM